jgi:hypothetical protein
MPLTVGCYILALLGLATALAAWQAVVVTHNATGFDGNNKSLEHPKQVNRISGSAATGMIRRNYVA